MKHLRYLRAVLFVYPRAILASASPRDLHPFPADEHSRRAGKMVPGRCMHALTRTIVNRYVTSTAACGGRLASV